MTESDNTTQNLPFISVLKYGNNEYVGIILNQDQYVTSFYDINTIRTPQEKILFLEIGESWWWESNRQFPISIFCKDQIKSFSYAIKTFNSKDVTILLGPVVNISSSTIKRKSVHLVRSNK